MIEYWPYLVCFFYAIIVGDFFVRKVVNELWKEYKGNQNFDQLLRPSVIHPQIVGIIERSLYVSALIMGNPEFIGLWLAVKVAGQWNRWSEGIENNNMEIIPGRAFFNIFLIGNGLSIAFAIIGFQFIAWFYQSKLSAAIIVPILLCLSSWILVLYIRHHTRSKI